MTTQNAFRIGSWVALAAGTLAALAAATTVIVGVLALSGKIAYPVDESFGPVSIRQSASLPVSFGGDVCQEATVSEPEPTNECLKFFIHDGAPTNSGGPDIRVQDADIRPISASLSGTAELATTGGWNGFVAASIAGKAINLSIISAVLLLLWRLLANSAKRSVFTSRSVTYVRAIGWLLIAGGVAGTMAGLFGGAMQFGYSFEAFGNGPHLAPGDNGGAELTPLALGALILLFAEVFRHGAAVEAEHGLTV